MTNPIDLGKLQEAAKNARANLVKAITANNKARHAADVANMRADMAWANVKKAQEALDRANQSVVDGARSVAQG